MAQRLSQAERTEISDARMLEAAIKLIVERGVPNTTLKDIGELAGFSRGLAGYRFGNRAGLFEFVVRSVGEEWLNELKAVTRGKVGIDAIEAAVNAHCRFCEEAPDHVFAFMGQLTVFPSFPILFDRDSEVSKIFGVKGLPTTLLIDKQGFVVYRAIGGRDFDHPEVQKIIRELLR